MCLEKKPQNHQGIQDIEHKSPGLLDWLCNKPFSALEDLNRHFSKGDTVFVCVQFFSDPMDYSRPSSSVHGISQAGILERSAISFPKNRNTDC